MYFEANKIHHAANVLNGRYSALKSFWHYFFEYTAQCRLLQDAKHITEIKTYDIIRFLPAYGIFLLAVGTGAYHHSKHCISVDELPFVR